jgi:tetratricopeptide (TPR) repeat protein/predicted Ser/Thr protein kinase
VPDAVPREPTWQGQHSADAGAAPGNVPNTCDGLDPTVGDLPPPGRDPEPGGQGSATQAAGASPAPAAAALPAIPGYEVLGVLGRGGMGVVYQARQTALRRLVALKMILAGGHATDEQRARFRTEAEAAARLQNPNVVQIHEVGEHDGLPFFSLEFVDGGSLAKRLDGTPWPPRQAAQLVEVLARAVHAAHQRGIVHRDLKPANVLLTADGTPKVTDFGLAKVLDATAGPTNTGAVLGTPSYMAPEQAGGYPHPTGPATDVYALGAVLYELLTGRPPFKGETPLATVAQVVGKEPVPPRALQPGVPRDLDTVCLKCLQKEPAKRYASAEALADDLRRFVAGQPILARPVGPLGRLGRWARRQPVVAGLLGALLLALVLGLSGVSLLWWRAETHLREAQRQHERAEDSFRDARTAVEQMLTEVGEERLKGLPEMDPVRRSLLERAAAFYEKFLRERGDDPAVREEAARAYMRVGLINGQLGRAPEAEAAYQQALTLGASLMAEAPQEPRYRRMMATTYSTGLGALHGGNQRYDEAEKSLLAAVPLLDGLVADFPDSAEYQEDLADCYNNLGVTYYDTHRLDQAETTLGKAQALYAQLAGANASKTGYRHRLAGSYNNLGMVYRDSNRLEQAEKAFREALTVSRALVEHDDRNPEYQYTQGRCCQNLGWLYLHHMGRPSKAQAAYEEGVQVWERLVRQHPAFVEYQSALAQTYGWLANIYGQQGLSAKAEGAYARLLEVAEPLVRLRPDVPKYRDDLADAYHHLGWHHHNAGRLDKAEAYYDKALPFRRELAQDLRIFKYQAGLGQVLHERGMLYAAQGRFKESEEAYQEAIQVRERLAQPPPADPPLLEGLAWSYHNLGNTFEATGQREKAEEVRAKALAIREDLARQNPKVLRYAVGLASSCVNTGKRLARTGKPRDALAWYERGIGLVEDVLRQEPGHLEAKEWLSACQAARAAALETLGQRRQAEECYQQALKFWQELAAAEPDEPDYQSGLAETYDGLARLLMQRGERARATLAASTVGLLASAPAPGPYLAASALLPESVEELPRARQLFQEAIRHEQKALKARPLNTEDRAHLVWQYARLGAVEKRLGQYDEAQKALEQAVALCERLAAEFPGVAEHLCDLGGVLNNLAEIQQRRGQLADARHSAEEAITRQQAALKLSPRSRRSRLFLGNHYGTLADVLVREGDHAGAVEAAAKKMAAFSETAENCFNAASLVARCMPLAEKDAGLPEEKRKALVQAYADQAMRYLRDGVAKGNGDLTFLRADPGFEPLRARADYKEVLAELEAKAKAAPNK